MSVPLAIGLCFVCLGMAEVWVAPQASGARGEDQNQSQEQLQKTARFYEEFLKDASLPKSSKSRVIDVEERLGAVYFLLHRYRDSLEVLRPVLEEKSPSKVLQKQSGKTVLVAQSWMVSGLDYLELNQLPDSIQALRRALALQPENATTRMALGDALARSGRMPEAATEYEAQTRRTPSLADAWYKLGMAHTQISVQVSREKVRPSEQKLAQQLSAEELLVKGDNLNAARLFFRVLRLAPSQPEVHAELGTALLSLGYAKAAEDHFHKELTGNPESPLALLGLSQTAALGRDWSQVSATLEHLSQSQPHELTRLLELPVAGLVVQAWNSGQISPPESFSTSPSGLLWTSWLSDSSVVARISSKGKENSSRGCLSSRAAARSPGIWFTESCYASLVAQLKGAKGMTANERIKLAEAEFRLGEYDATLRLAKGIRSIDEESGWGVYWLSKAHDGLAEECFLKVGALNPDSSRVHQMLAEHYSELSDYPRAKSEFQDAIRSAPNSPDLHLGLGTVLSRSGDWVGAEKELTASLEWAPESAFAHYQLGHVYVQQSFWQKAMEQLRRVPSDSTIILSARIDLAKAESETGQLSQAVQDLLSVAPLDRDGEVYFRLAHLYRDLGDEARARNALATFKQLRAASLQTDKDELGALEKEQGSSQTEKLQSP